jgi:hypothetical protein
MTPSTKNKRMEAAEKSIAITCYAAGTTLNLPCSEIAEVLRRIITVLESQTEKFKTKGEADGPTSPDS